MPTLPTLTVTDEQANRMLAAYGSVDEYTKWLKNSIIDYVISYEAKAMNANFRAQMEQAMEDARASLGYDPS